MFAAKPFVKYQMPPSLPLRKPLEKSAQQPTGVFESRGVALNAPKITKLAEIPPKGILKSSSSRKFDSRSSATPTKALTSRKVRPNGTIVKSKLPRAHSVKFGMPPSDLGHPSEIQDLRKSLFPSLDLTGKPELIPLTNFRKGGLPPEMHLQMQKESNSTMAADYHYHPKNPLLKGGLLGGLLSGKDKLQADVSKKGKLSGQPRPANIMKDVMEEFDKIDNMQLHGETFMADQDRIRKELSRIRLDNKTSGRPFCLGTGTNKRTVMSKSERNMIGDIRKELQNVVKEKPKEDKTFAAIHKRIQDKREEWKNMKLTTTMGAKVKPSTAAPATGLLNTIGKRSYILPPPTRPDPDTKAIVNDKLEEISRHFRDSLKISLNSSKKGIKTEKFPPGIYSDNYRFMGDKTRRKKSFKWDEDAFGKFPEDLMNSIEKEIPNEFKIEAMTNPSLVKRSNSESRKKTASKLPPKSASKSKIGDGPTDSSLDLAGVVKLRSLLEANTSELFSNKVKEGAPALDNHRKMVDPQYPHQPINKLVGPPKNLDPFMVARQAIKQKRAGELKFEIQHDKYDRNSMTDSKFEEKSPHSGNAKGMKSQTQGKRQEEYQNISAERVQQRIGESVRTLDDAAKVANALGSLMTRVASTQPKERRASGAQTTGHRARGSMTPSGKMTGNEIQTQTERNEPYFWLKPKMPEIKFTKDMSPSDQKRLEELRAKKIEWDKEMNSASAEIHK